MKRIASFTVNHNVLQPGVYVSRIDDDIITYDLRFKKPNSDDYLSNLSMHTIEHLFATYSRNSKYQDNVVYFGPMGCRTGFYFLLRGVDKQDALNLIKETMQFISSYNDEIPGCTAIECGNYLEHDLECAKKDATQYLGVIKSWTVENMEYMA